MRDGRLPSELTCHSHMIALLLPLGLAYARRSPTILQKLAVHIFIPYSTGGYESTLWLRRNPIYALLYLAKQVPDPVFDPLGLQAHALAACPVDTWRSPAETDVHTPEVEVE